MKVTEHNMDDCDLNAEEIDDIIRLIKREIRHYQDNLKTQLFYAKMLGKLLGMKHTVDT